ncbi:MAG: 2-oxoacid ferredoxin oxidoreductase [Bacilli bacterium]|nr:2-oxoacid ferredoxin oxidoreductase [Bacilli bacterium]
MAKVIDFKYDKPTWCPGCGDYTVLAAMQQACVGLGLEPEQVCCVSGIGCAGKIAQHFGGYGFHSLHGRSIPTATGIKLANQELVVIAAGGDGDGYGIGLGHSLHAMRRNIDITYIVMDNHIYGLTTGKLSPNSQKGFKTKTSPKGSAEDPIRPVEMAIVTGSSFVAQAFSGNVKQMVSIFEQGIKHKGFSLINVFSPCVTFNKVNTYDWFKEHIVNMDEDESFDPTNRMDALRRVHEVESVCTGVIYREERPAFHETMLGASETAGVHLDLDLAEEEMQSLIDQFRR